MRYCRRCGKPVVDGEEYETTYAGSVSGGTGVINYVHKACFQSFPAGAAGARREEAAPNAPVGRP